MSFPLKFQFPDRMKLVSGLVFLFSFILFCFLFSLQLKVGFSQVFFAVAFIFMNVAFYFFFQFLKTMLSPVVQVFPDQVIVRLWRREVIALENIKSLRVRSGEMELSYVREGVAVSKKFRVSRRKCPQLEIVDGKILE